MVKDELMPILQFRQNLIWKDKGNEQSLKGFQDESDDVTMKLCNEALNKKAYDESREILIGISKILGLGKIILKEDGNDFYLPSFYIKADSSLNARERMNLNDEVMDLLFDALQKEDKLEYLKKFFIKLDFYEQ